MLGVAHFGSAQQNEFDTYLLDAIAAVVVGGTSLFGGRGGIGNTIVGLFVLGVLNNGLDHVNIDSFLKILIRGLILLAALVINVYAAAPADDRGAIGRGAAAAAPVWAGTLNQGRPPSHVRLRPARRRRTRRARHGMLRARPGSAAAPGWEGELKGSRGAPCPGARPRRRPWGERPEPPGVRSCRVNSTTQAGVGRFPLAFRQRKIL